VQATNGVKQENLAYNPLGNRISRTVNGSTDYSIYDAANQLLEVHANSATGPLQRAFVYDANGNLIKKAEGGTVTRSATDCTNFNDPSGRNQSIASTMETYFNNELIVLQNHITL